MGSRDPRGRSSIALRWLPLATIVAVFLTGVVSSTSTRSSLPLVVGTAVAMTIGVVTVVVGGFRGIPPPRASLLGVAAWLALVVGFIAWEIAFARDFEPGP